MIDKDTIRKWWSVFVGDGQFCEVRILGRFQYSGYFKNVENLIKQIEPYTNMDDEQCYFTLNMINSDCYGRHQSEKFIKSPKVTTNDTDIVARQWVMIDFDPVRATGVNASDEEFELAHKKAQTVFRYLRDKGFADPVICKSGNGWHLQYYIDCENTEKNTDIIKRFLQSLGKMFTDDKVDIDEKVFNAGRICKLYGTMAKKGANIQERPWRMSEIVYVPKELLKTDICMFEEIAELLPKEEPKPLPNRRPYMGNGAPFDLVSWMVQHGIKYREKKSGTSTLYELEECPWIDTHSDRKKWDSALFVDADGKITFNCTHSHCKGKTWQDVRLKYEPDAYNKPAYQPMPMYQPMQRMQPVKPKYELKEETPELGKKWLCLCDIEDIDIAAIHKFKTGFAELDKAILGLNDGEVTLLSGGNASGKSSWLNSVLLNVINQGELAALWSGELPAPVLKSWIHMPAAGKNNLRRSAYGENKFFVPNNVKQQIDAWTCNKLFLYNNAYGNNYEQILHEMEELLKIGVHFFVLDNLFSMNIDFIEGDKNKKQTEFILKIKDFAKYNNAHIILVAHPRKTTAFLRKNDISGTADLTNAVDNVFIIHRVNNDFFRVGAEYFGQNEINRFQPFGNVLEVCKNRMWGVVDLMIGMHYEIESRRFKNTVDEQIKYGWELPPTQGTMSFNEPEQVQVFAEQQKEPFAETTVYEENDDMPFGAPVDGAPF